jgi:hypothetical protein
MFSTESQIYEYCLTGIPQFMKDTYLPVLLQIPHNPAADVEVGDASLKEVC